MRGICGCVRLAALLAVACAAPGAAAAGESCHAAMPGRSAEAAGARNAQTVTLKDGREVRLAGIQVLDALDGNAEAGRRATAALDALVAGRRVILHAQAATPDRYERVSAQVVAGGVWVQQALVGRGFAYAMPNPDDASCAAGLLAAEEQARRAGAGFWGDGTFSLADGSAVPLKLAAEGRFAVVEGTVRRIGESGGRIFLDFGRRYREDFTIVIPREAHAAFADAGVDLRGLSGTGVRARGVLFEWGGPAMELRVPAALERTGTDAQ